MMQDVADPLDDGQAQADAFSHATSLWKLHIFLENILQRLFGNAGSAVAHFEQDLAAAAAARHQHGALRLLGERNSDRDGMF